MKIENAPLMLCLIRTFLRNDFWVIIICWLVREQSLWVAWHYYLVHYTFMWRRMYRAYERGWNNAHLHAYNHTLHCQKVLLRTGVAHDEAFTKGNVIYPVCERVRRRMGFYLLYVNTHLIAKLRTLYERIQPNPASLLGCGIILPFANFPITGRVSYVDGQ